MEPLIRPAMVDDLPAILGIYNDVILNSTAAYVYEPHTLEMRRQWFDEHKAYGWPVIVAVRDGEVVGFGCIGSFRTRPGYKYTGEHTVHVHPAHRGQGVGRTMLTALIEEARRLELRTLVSGIDAENEVSIRLHASLGFVECARMKDVAWKFGRWLDLVLMQLLLEGPTHPTQK